MYYRTISKDGAGTKSRTRDPLITSQVLYQLSYTGKESELCRQCRTLARNLSESPGKSE
ncbi:hypothetical protein [Neisseria meningitidis serogroup B]|uniref:Uncharacterized protein n=1 Tax=Neisseria meningitidis serogroup B TaxID=491 RepID=A0A0H5Q8Z9_NEIMI|nr:hypothetical protein [Neisseria meningitidis serogroup B]